MARAMEATFCARRWQDTALNLIGDLKSAARAGPELACGLRGSVDTLPSATFLKGNRFGPPDNLKARVVSTPAGDATCSASGRYPPKELEEVSDDSQLIRALFPEVVASVSAEQEPAKPVQIGPLGLKLNHSDVLRAWETQSGLASKRAVSSTSADTIFESLHIKPAKAALEVTCGPLPCYDLSHPSSSLLPFQPMSMPQSLQDLWPDPAMSGSAPASGGLSMLRLGPNALQPVLPRAGSINAASGYSSCSTGSLSCCSSPVSHSVPPEALQPLESLLDGVPMEVGASCLDSSVGCLKADLEELAASQGPSCCSSPDEFRLLLSDSDDASDGTQFSAGHLWGGSEDAYDSIFGSADADVSMCVDNYHTIVATEDTMLLAPFSANQHCMRSRAQSSHGGFPAAASFGVAAIPVLKPASSICSNEVFPTVSFGDPIGTPFHDLDQDSTIGFGALTPAVPLLPASPQYDSLLRLHDGPYFPDATLAELPQSLVAIPAKTAECAKSARAACALKCKEKRQNRHPAKICYEMRKVNADKRPRFKGRFVKRADLIAKQVEEYSEVLTTALSDDLAICFTYPTDPFLDEICTL